MAFPPSPSKPSPSKSASAAIWSHKDGAIFIVGVIGAGAASLAGVLSIRENGSSCVAVLSWHWWHW